MRGDDVKVEQRDGAAGRGCAGGEGVAAVVFDAYGTLLDFASAAAAHTDRLGDKARPLIAKWRDKQLQYTWLRSLQGEYVDFWQVTLDSLDYCLDELQINAPDLRRGLMASYSQLECFAEVPEALAGLQSAGYRMAILSNGTAKMLASATQAAGIHAMFERIFSADEVGTFKTSPAVYQLVLDWLGCRAGSIVFVSSNAWDAHAASAFGMKVVWCNRYGQRRENLPGAPDAEVNSLRGLTQVVASLVE